MFIFGRFQDPPKRDPGKFVFIVPLVRCSDLGQSTSCSFGVPHWLSRMQEANVQEIGTYLMSDQIPIAPSRTFCLDTKDRVLALVCRIYF